MWERTYIAEVGEENARVLATESRTAWLASEYRPMDIGEGRISLSELALGASRELGEEEDGAITEDAEGLRIWVGDDAFELVVQK
ncbi:MAG TPA: hypothetical protein VHZ97_22030 [Pseudonocardiaceae bacterium]|jgi:hypothetical protein|nr:hypothetical protein [Pseudonocardiaceae bacterium]